MNFPSYMTECPICGQNTWPLYRDNPDTDWHKKVQSALEELADAADGEENARSIYPHRHDARARIYQDAGGRLWVTHAELLDQGYDALVEDSIIFINDTFYELQSYSHGGASWWIEAVKVDGAAESLDPSMFLGDPEA